MNCEFLIVNCEWNTKIKLKYCIFIFLVLSNFCGYSQYPELIKKGRLELEIGNYQKAIEDFSEAIRLNNEQEEAHFLRGKAYFETKNYNNALNDFSKSIILNAQKADNYYHRGLTHTKVGNQTKAIQDFSQALVFQADDIETLLARANAYRILKKYNESLTDCQTILTQFPRNANAYQARGRVNLDIKEAQNALKDFQTALTFEQNNKENLVFIGIAKYNLGKNEECKQNFEQYLQLAQKSKDYHFIATQIQEYINSNEWLEKAQIYTLTAIKLLDNYENNHLYAQILYKLQKQLNCLEVSEKAISLAKKEGLDYTTTQFFVDRINQTNTDDIPPTITLVSPTLVSIAPAQTPAQVSAQALMRGGIVVSTQNEINIIGKVTDESGVKEVFVNGNPAQLAENGDFKGILLLKKELKVFVIEATDFKGNTQKATFSINRDTNAVAALPRSKSMGRCYALIFATNQYEYWNNLVNPIKDAETIAKELNENYEFQTDMVFNATQNQILLKIKEYVQKKYEPNDQLLIFFAGHGQFDEVFKEGYVVPQDAKLNDEAKTSYLSHSVLRTYINNIPSKHILLMMDVCFGGTFNPLVANSGMRGDNKDNFSKSNPKNGISNELEEFIRRKLQNKTRKYLTSGGKEYVPDGNPGEHSPFVRHFLTALRTYGGQDKLLTISEIIGFIEKITPQPQTGDFGSNEPGSDFLFMAK